MNPLFPCFKYTIWVVLFRLGGAISGVAPLKCVGGALAAGPGRPPTKLCSAALTDPL